MTVSGAEFKVTLGALGLPPGWFAEQMNVTMRTVVRWFDGEWISDQVEEKLKELEGEALAMMRVMISNAPKVGGAIVLYTYRTDADMANVMPATWHRALTFRVMEHLRAQGKTVRVRWQE